MSFGKRILELRKQCNFSMRAVADYIGCSAAAVNDWEKDKFTPNAENIFKLAEILKTTPEYILTGIVTSHEATYQYSVFDTVDDFNNKKTNKHITDSVMHPIGAFYWVVQDESMSCKHSQYKNFSINDMVLVYPSEAPKDGDYVLARHRQKDIVAVRYYLAQGGIVLLRVGNSIFESLNGNLETYEIMGVIKQQIVRFE